jgi:hypothetical protein
LLPATLSTIDECNSWITSEFYRCDKKENFLERYSATVKSTGIAQFLTYITLLFRSFPIGAFQ